MTPLRKEVMRLVEHARKHEAELHAARWPKAKTDALVESLDALEASTVVDEATVVRLETQEFWEAIRLGFKFKLRLTAHLRVVGRGRPEILCALPVSVERPRDVMQLEQWLGETYALMEALRFELEKDSSVDWFAAVDEEVERLCIAHGTLLNHQAQRANFAKKRVAARAALMQGIDALCAHAAKAFARKPAVRKLFHKVSGQAHKEEPPTQELDAKRDIYAPVTNSEWGFGGDLF